MTRVLVVDDDPAVLSGLRRALALEGYDVVVAADGEHALTAAANQIPDLTILDVMLPGIDGLRVCQRLRAVSAAPIMMLTARDTVPDRVAGLDMGADDYVVKPFSLDELLARVRALLRRGQKPDDTLEFEDIELNVTTMEASRDGEPLRLTPNEIRLLEAFLRYPRKVLSRKQLAQQVWGYDYDGESNYVDVAIKDLRKKLEIGDRPRIIQTVRGFGYSLRGS